MENLFIKLLDFTYISGKPVPIPIKVDKIIDPFLNWVDRSSFLGTEFLGNSILNYILFAVVFIVLMLFLKPLIKLIISTFGRLANKTSTDIDNKILDYFSTKTSKSLVSLEIVLALYLALKFLWLSPYIENIIDSAAIIFITIFIVSTIIDVIKHIINSKYTTEEDTHRNSLLLIFPVIKIAVWILAGFFVLSNLGYDVSALLAGLGIGGVALALASQSFLSDLISFVSIASDKPIEIGDYISINGIEGTVKKIGIKSTRIERNLGEEVIVPNSTITGSNLFNYKRLEKRRFDVVLKIDMKTPNEKLQMIPEIVKKLITEYEVCELVRCSLDTIDEFSYNFTAIVNVLTSDGTIFFNCKEDFIYKIRTELETNDIYFAYPSMCIIDKK